MSATTREAADALWQALDRMRHVEAYREGKSSAIPSCWAAIKFCEKALGTLAEGREPEGNAGQSPSGPAADEAATPKPPSPPAGSGAQGGPGGQTRAELLNLYEECRGWHQALDGRTVGDGAFTIRCENGESEQTRLNLRATLRDVSTVLLGLVSLTKGSDGTGGEDQEGAPEAGVGPQAARQALTVAINVLEHLDRPYTAAGLRHVLPWFTDASSRPDQPPTPTTAKAEGEA